MTKIKICGLSHPCDINYVNEAKPDYCGFIINFPKSYRNVSPDTVRALRTNLNPAVLPVGVFVDAPVDLVAELLNDGTLAMAQLHGSEDESYIESLREKTDRPLIQAFRVRNRDDTVRAAQSSADHLMLDNGQGSGKTFDWSLVRDFPRPFFLAGGLGPGNLIPALAAIHPYAVDMSSGVETEGRKDPQKIQAAVAVVRSFQP